MEERKFQNLYFWFTISEYTIFMIRKRGISNVYDELVIRVQSILEKILQLDTNLDQLKKIKDLSFNTFKNWVYANKLKLSVEKKKRP